MKYSSKLIEDAVEQFASLPGVGRRSALRLVLSLLKRDPADIQKFSLALQQLSSRLTYCHSCHNISDTSTCSICANPRRDRSLLCVVEDIRDVMALENTQHYNGLYHVLGGIISPIDGIGPNDLNIASLMEKAKSGEVKEIIFALNSGMEGETTNFYLYRKLRDFPLVFSNIARGIAIGDELEYADEVTLGRSIVHRIPFESTFQNK
ncbi:MAG: recombination mediator RecR [Bacteroidota bacterium]